MALIPAPLRTTFPNVELWTHCGAHRFRGRASDSWRYVVTNADETRYFTMLIDEWRQSLDPKQEDHLFRKLEVALAHDLLPVCVVPGCREKASMAFTATENGRLASHDWARGNRINLCPGHAYDVHRAQGVYGLDQLAEWLRPDAMLDWIDGFDAEDDLLLGDQIEQGRARMLRVLDHVR